MPSVKLVALKKIRYPRGGTDGKEYNVGDSFEVQSERDAEALTKIRFAKYPDKVKTRPLANVAPPVQTRSMQPEQTEQPKDELFIEQGTQPRAPGTGNRYARRDMRSTEE